METLKYSIIKDPQQYKKYCKILEELIIRDEKGITDEVELLTLLIEKWDNEHSTCNDSGPVELIKVLMEENDLKAKDLADILNLSKGTISKILNYHKGLSKETIRNLAEYFKINQEALNRPYKLVSEANGHLPKTSLIKKKKIIIEI